MLPTTFETHDLERVNRALGKTTSGKRAISRSAEVAHWTPYHEFSTRCNNDPNIVARARSWIQEEVYWELETRHFQVLVSIMNSMAYEGDSKHTSSFPDMDDLEDAFGNFKEAVYEAYKVRDKSPILTRKSYTDLLSSLTFHSARHLAQQTIKLLLGIFDYMTRLWYIPTALIPQAYNVPAFHLFFVELTLAELLPLYPTI
ncbi:hypothetical protein BDZ85DRAFT_280915 [Elsinoe ampelina]|uniref:Uncharacterized protein n=1 Tax=Elsinoe ampelina TaxID=302913 RepID=A0A6A6GF44_9PEZI|nr:hypothetical protein BDZ85DRAFT_280915 [Elsinoe ampelina]